MGSPFAGRPWLLVVHAPGLSHVRRLCDAEQCLDVFLGWQFALPRLRSAQAQGNAMWIGSMEWRLPIVQDVEWDVADHAVGLRNLYFAPFYDGGDIYANHHQVGSIAQAVGLGLRAEVAWLSFIERTTIRIDFAKTINATSNLQVWMGIMQPF